MSPPPLNAAIPAITTHTANQLSSQVATQVLELVPAVYSARIPPAGMNLSQAQLMPPPPLKVAIPAITIYTANQLSSQVATQALGLVPAVYSALIPSVGLMGYNYCPPFSYPPFPTAPSQSTTSSILKESRKRSKLNKTDINQTYEDFLEKHVKELQKHVGKETTLNWWANSHDPIRKVILIKRVRSLENPTFLIQQIEPKKTETQRAAAPRLAFDGKEYPHHYANILPREKPLYPHGTKGRWKGREITIDQNIYKNSDKIDISFIENNYEFETEASITEIEIATDRSASTNASNSEVPMTRKRKKVFSYNKDKQPLFRTAGISAQWRGKNFIRQVTINNNFYGDDKKIQVKWEENGESKVSQAWPKDLFIDPPQGAPSSSPK